MPAELGVLQKLGNHSLYVIIIISLFCSGINIHRALALRQCFSGNGPMCKMATVFKLSKRFQRSPRKTCYVGTWARPLEGRVAEQRERRKVGLCASGPTLSSGRLSCFKEYWLPRKFGSLYRVQMYGFTNKRVPGWVWPNSALITSPLPSCLLRVGTLERDSCVLIYQNLTSPSWTPVTLTQPHALGSCSGARRRQRQNPVSTALMTLSSSR